MVTHPELARVFSALAASITYGNFKNHIATLPEQRPKLPAYHDFWTAMYQLQQRNLAKPA